MLDDYDHKTLSSPKGSDSNKKIKYKDCLKIITELKEAKKVKLFVFHTCREEDCKKLMEYLKKSDPKFSDVEMHMVTPAVGAHIGPGILAFGYYILDL